VQHFTYRTNTRIDRKAKLLGKGAYSKVYRFMNDQAEHAYAVKVHGHGRRSVEDGCHEIRVLHLIWVNDRDDLASYVRLHDYFSYRGKIHIITHLYGMGLDKFLKRKRSLPLPLSQVQNLAQQLFRSVAFLHDMKLVHTDIKLENILLDDDTGTLNIGSGMPSTIAGYSYRKRKPSKIPVNKIIRLGDFGSATFEEEEHASEITTRPYRAPEVILKQRWSLPSDI